MNTKTKRLTALNYFGGKARYLDWLLPLIDVPSVTHYVEPFCGAASVFLNKKPHPVETINDLDKRLINFFRVLREKPNRLVGALALSPCVASIQIIKGTGKRANPSSSIPSPSDPHTCGSRHSVVDTRGVPNPIVRRDYVVVITTPNT